MVLMRTDLAADPRVVRVAAATKSTKVQVIGALHWLWSMGQTQSNDGYIPLVTFEAIDAEVGIPGFASAMQSAEWLEESEGGVLIPDFEVYNGKSAKTRAKDRLRKTRERWNEPKGKGKSGQTSDKTRTKSGQNVDRVGTELGQKVDKKWTTTNNGSDRIGSDLNVSDRSERNAGDAHTEGSASRFLADRKIRTGNLPAGFVRFLDAYPPFRATGRDKALIAWEAQGCEAEAEAVCAGLEAWKACDEWAVENVVPNADKFLNERRWGIKPPPPRKAQTALGGAW